MNLPADHPVYFAYTSIAYLEYVFVWIEQGIESRVDHFSHLHHTLTRVVVPHKVVEYDLGYFHDSDVTN